LTKPLHLSRGAVTLLETIEVKLQQTFQYVKHKNEKLRLFSLMPHKNQNFKNYGYFHWCV